MGLMFFKDFTDPSRMKVRPLEQNTALLNRVQERRDGGGQGQQQSSQDSQKREDPPRVQVNETEVQNALQTFATDKQVQASGLQAEAQGQGPGLRVVLKDGQGRFLRQMTGEEFVKLKETLADKLPQPGKILDQKF